jgi:hypothetical protein
MNWLIIRKMLAFESESPGVSSPASGTEGVDRPENRYPFLTNQQTP